MLSEQNIEAELSYAYLHAVATRCGFGCSSAPKYLDDVSVDAVVHEEGRLLAPDSIHASFALHVQLKATRQPTAEREGRLSFKLPLHQYNRLRDHRVIVPRILVVLFLPPNPADWVSHSEESLVARRCAYWVSLLGAPASENAATQTVYLPRSQPLSPEALVGIMTRCSREEEIRYEH